MMLEVKDPKAKKIPDTRKDCSLQGRGELKESLWDVEVRLQKHNSKGRGNQL